MDVAILVFWALSFFSPLRLLEYVKRVHPSTWVQLE
jgi:hypothetical protein